MLNPTTTEKITTADKHKRFLALERLAHSFMREGFGHDEAWRRASISWRLQMTSGNSSTTAHNEWKETVRDIFDLCHLGPDSLFHGNPLARVIVEMIERRHHDYFCEAKTIEEWEAERNTDE